MKVRAFLSTILIIFCLNCIAQIKLNFNYSSYAKEVNRAYVVLKSSTNDIKDNEKVFYKDGQFLELPDHTKILSETQIYFSED